MSPVCDEVSDSIAMINSPIGLLHKACIEGNIESMKSILSEYPNIKIDKATQFDISVLYDIDTSFRDEIYEDYHFTNSFLDAAVLSNQPNMIQFILQQYIINHPNELQIDTSLSKVCEQLRKEHGDDHIKLNLCIKSQFFHKEFVSAIVLSSITNKVQSFQTLLHHYNKKHIYYQTKSCTTFDDVTNNTDLTMGVLQYVLRQQYFDIARLFIARDVVQFLSQDELFQRAFYYILMDKILPAINFLVQDFTFSIHDARYCTFGQDEVPLINFACDGDWDMICQLIEYDFGILSCYNLYELYKMDDNWYGDHISLIECLSLDKNVTREIVEKFLYHYAIPLYDDESRDFGMYSLNDAINHQNYVVVECLIEYHSHNFQSFELLWGFDAKYLSQFISEVINLISKDVLKRFMIYASEHYLSNLFDDNTNCLIDFHIDVLGRDNAFKLGEFGYSLVHYLLLVPAVNEGYDEEVVVPTIEELIDEIVNELVEEEDEDDYDVEEEDSFDN